MIYDKNLVVDDSTKQNGYVLIKSIKSTKPVKQKIKLYKEVKLITIRRKDGIKALIKALTGFYFNDINIYIKWRWR
jgi:hypothetical protein